MPKELHYAAKKTFNVIFTNGSKVCTILKIFKEYILLNLIFKFSKTTYAKEIALTEIIIGTNIKR